MTGSYFRRSSLLRYEGVTRFRIGYFGDGAWARLALEALVADDTIELAFVCARAGTPDPELREMAGVHGIDFVTHPKINSSDFVEWAAAHSCDLFVSMSFDQIFHHELINLPRLTTINCHAGKLPFYRGRNGLNWVLINDEKEFGITVHFVDEGVDTGDIVLQRTYPISDEDDYSTLLARAHRGCADLLGQAVKAFQAGDIRRTPQSAIHPLGFYCTARREGDERLEWNQSSREVFSFVRAVCRPGPEARTSIRGVEIRVNKLRWLPNAPVYKGIPGAVIGTGPKSFLVKTSDSYVEVVDWSGCDKPRIGERLR